MLKRLLDLNKFIKRKSIFLLGPRQSGKSTLLKNTFPNAKIINLLKNSEFLRYQREPDLLIQEYEQLKKELIIIDEIQRLPELLNNVHYLIEECQHRFILTGSSARKLKKEGVNLLAGRAAKIHFHPLISLELGDKFKLERALSYGLLPSVYLSNMPDAELKDYVGLYLKEEIMAEGLVRNLNAFSAFLDIAAVSHGKMINYAKVAKDAGVPPSTVTEYFKLLCDTLIGHELLALGKTIKRKPIQTSKFYFFDNGVVRALLKKTKIHKSDADYGDYFEAFIFHELLAYKNYIKDCDIRYWRSVSDHEVDFILDEQVAIEVKATTKVNDDDLKGLLALNEEKICKNFYLISQDPKVHIKKGITCLPYNLFLEKLFDGQIV